MYAVKLYTMWTLFLLAVSSANSFASNSSIDDKGDLFGVVSGKEKLFKLGLTSFVSIGDNKDKVLTTWDDMRAVGITTKMVQDAYQRMFGVRPNNQHLNDAFCRKNRWHSYNYLGEIKVTNVKEQPKSSAVHKRYLTNDGDNEFTQTVDMSKTVSDSTTVTVTWRSEISTTASISLKAESLGISLDAELSNTFTLSNSVGSTHTLSKEVTVGDKTEVHVPPHSKKNVTLVVTWISRTSDWEMPVHIDPQGMTGVDFHRRINGHYFWGAEHAALADPPFMSVIRGRLDSSYGTIGTVHVEDL